jgi:hypothetical protein
MSEALPSLALVLNQMRGQPPSAAWRQLRALAGLQVPLLSAPQPGMPGLCAVCRGPAGRGSTCCFQCDLHRQCAPGSLAATVVPIAYAIKGGSHALNLWQYKSERLRAAPALAGRSVAAVAAERLRALLLVFLRDHGACVWRAAGMPGGPTHLAVVPTARGRPGTHPLRALIAPYLAGRWAELSALSGTHPVRDLDPARFGAVSVPGARVLLLDDTWTTGSTAQSAALALRRSGARSVAIVVLGRHVTAGRHSTGRAESATASATRGRLAQGADDGAGVDPAAMPFRQQACAVHEGRL